MGLMVDINAITDSRIAVLGIIFTLAIADSMSDALGIHMAEEARTYSTTQSIWLATFTTFITKAVITLTFTLPVLLLNLKLAILISIIWGILLISSLSYKVAIDSHQNPIKVISEHLMLAFVVIVLSNFMGEWIVSSFS